MKDGIRGIALVLTSTVFTAAGQIFFKRGSAGLVWDAGVLLANYPLWAGFVAYGLGALMLIAALKHGELSVLYPIYALNFVWVSVLSPAFFPADSMNTVKWMGVLLVVAGVSAIGLGSGREAVE